MNVGNSTPDFKPSKTFEYIASGKPILNIYYKGQFDEVLAKSPLALQLSRDLTVQEAASKLRGFLETSSGSILHTDKIDELYLNHSAKSIQNMLNRTFSR